MALLIEKLPAQTSNKLCEQKQQEEKR